MLKYLQTPVQFSRGTAPHRDSLCLPEGRNILSGHSSHSLIPNTWAGLAGAQAAPTCSEPWDSQESTLPVGIPGTFLAAPCLGNFSQHFLGRASERPFVSHFYFPKPGPKAWSLVQKPPLKPWMPHGLSLWQSRTEPQAGPGEVQVGHQQEFPRGKGC